MDCVVRACEVCGECGRRMTVDARRDAFAGCVHRLGLSGDVEKKAWNLVEWTEKNGAEQEVGFRGASMRRTREACAVYVAKRLVRMPTVGGGELVNGGVPMTTVLREMQLSVVDFVRELRFFVLSLEAYFNGAADANSRLSSDAVEKQLQVRQMEVNLLYLCTLRSKYHSVVRALFHTETSADVVVRFGWLLFILGKAKTLSANPSLSDQIFLFVAMLEVLLANAPESYIRPLEQMMVIRNVPLVMMRDSEGKPDTLASLCAYHKASQADVLPVMDKLIGMLKELLPASVMKSTTSIRNMSNTCPRFEGLLDLPARARMNLQALEKAYDNVCITSCELDERVFDGENVLLGDPRTLTPVHPGSKVRNITTPGRAAAPGTRGGGGAPAWLAASPAHNGLMVPPRTPVSETMAASQWLRREVEQIEQSPTPELRSVLDSIGQQAAAILGQRINDLVHLPFPTQPRRRIEATKLYWKWLDLMVAAERGRGASVNSLKKALSSQTFHCAILACAIELIVASYKIPDLVFPAVPKLLKLDVFELTKVVGSFVRAETGLPKELKRHLNNLEERILESLAWQRGSKLYKELRAVQNKDAGLRVTAATPGAEAELHTATTPRAGRCAGDGNAGEESTRRQDESAGVHPSGIGQGGLASSAFQAFHSPIKVRTNNQSQELQQQEDAKDNDQKIGGDKDESRLPQCFGVYEEKDSLEHVTGPEAALRLFFKKVSMLASKRLADLGDQLRLPEQVKQHVYDMVVRVLYEHSNLMYNRHLDQVILCSLYGVCKTQSDTSMHKQFKEIINVYKKNPARRQEVFRTVVLEQTDPGLQVQKKGSVIDFYNKVFVPVMKELLLGLPDADAPTRDKKNKEDSQNHIQAGDASALPSQVSPVKVAPPSVVAPPSDCRTPPPRFHSTILNSPSRIQKGSNVYVSPLRSRPGDITPRTKSLIAFVGESTSAFKTPGRELDELSKDIRSRPVSLRLDLDQYATHENADGNGSIYWNSQQSNGKTGASKRLKLSNPQSSDSEQ